MPPHQHPLTSSKPPDWTKPTKAHGPKWNEFLMSNLRNNHSCRRQAKCTYCQKIFNQAKPTQLFNHIKNNCPSIPAEKRSAYIKTCLASECQTSSKALETEPSNSDDSPNQCINVNIPSGKTSSQPPTGSVNQYFCQMSAAKINQLHKLILKLLISSNVHLSFLENPYFQEYQSELAHSPYQLPRRVQTMEKILPMVHARHEVELLEKLKGQQQLTLSLDGWTDNSGNSIYALMFLKGAKKK